MSYMLLSVFAGESYGLLVSAYVLDFEKVRLNMLSIFFCLVLMRRKATVATSRVGVALDR